MWAGGLSDYFFAPALRAAQYFFIRRLTAFRAAADILLRFVPAAALSPWLGRPRIESDRLPATAAIAARIPLSSRWPRCTTRSAAASASLNVFNTFDFAINVSAIRKGIVETLQAPESSTGISTGQILGRHGQLRFLKTEIH
jgi:hypothetical protein